MPKNHTQSKQDVAKRLAGFHFRVERGLVKVVQIATSAGDNETSIVLLEVNKNTVPAGIMPLGFAPAPARGIPYSSVIIEVTPEEYQEIKKSRLRLPNGWRLGEEIPKAEAVALAAE